MSEVTLQQYLEAFGLDLSTTKLHIIREPSASKCWEQSQIDENSDIENIAKIETACNPKSHWINTSHIAVLLD